MPAWLVPAMMGGKMALDLIGGFQARRDARERQQKMNEQSARGRFLSHLSPKAALGVAGSPQIPIPNIAGQLGSAADPLLSLLMSREQGQPTNADAASAAQAAPAPSVLPRDPRLTGGATGGAQFGRNMGAAGGADPEVMQRILRLLMQLRSTGAMR